MNNEKTTGNAGGGVKYDNFIRPYNDDITWNAKKLDQLVRGTGVLSLNKTTNIVETGVGTGRLAKEFLQIASMSGYLANIRYYGFDHSDNQLEQAEQNLNDYNSNIILQRADVLHEDFFTNLDNDVDVITNSAFLGYISPGKLKEFLTSSVDCLISEKEKRPEEAKSLALFHGCGTQHTKNFILFAENLLLNKFDIDNPEQFRILHQHDLPNNTIENTVLSLLKNNVTTKSLSKKSIPAKVEYVEEWMKLWAQKYQDQLKPSDLKDFNRTVLNHIKEYQKKCPARKFPYARRSSIFTI